MAKKNSQLGDKHTSCATSDKECVYKVVEKTRGGSPGGNNYRSSSLKTFNNSPYRGKNENAYFPLVVGPGRD